MKKLIKAYLVDTEKQETRPVEIEDELETYYRMLNCDTIEIHTIALGPESIEYDCVMDEEARLKVESRLSAIDCGLRAVFLGSLMVVGKADGKGELTSLTDDDIEYIESECVRNIATTDHPEGNVMLTDVQML